MKILWVSRHSLTDEQRESLLKHFGEFELIQYDKTVNDVNEIVSDDIDVYAVVLPTELLSRLFKEKNEKSRIITPVSERVFTENYIINPATGTKEKEYKFVHKCWIEYLKIEIETNILI